MIHSEQALEPSGDLAGGMVLYLSHGSVCCSKVELVLEEKGLKAQYRVMDHRAGETHTPEYLALNPRGVIPTLVDRGRPIIESTVICEYLEDAYPQMPLRPLDPLDRATMRLWTQRPDAGLHTACAKVSFSFMTGVDFTRQMTAARPPTATQLGDVIALGLDAPGLDRFVGLYDLTFAEMAKQLDQTEWLAGDVFSLADIALIPYVMRFEKLGLSWMWRDDSRRSRVAEWLAACKRRPSFAPVFDKVVVPPGGLNGEDVREKVSALVRSYYG